MTDRQLYRLRDPGGLPLSEAVHPLAGLRSLPAEGLEVEVRSRRLLDPPCFVCRIARAAVCMTAGLVLAHDVATRAVAGLHDPSVPSLVTPVLRVVLSAVSPRALPRDAGARSLTPLGGLGDSRSQRYSPRTAVLPPRGSLSTTETEFPPVPRPDGLVDMRMSGRGTT